MLILEIILGIIFAITLEPLLYFIIEKIQKKKKKIEPIQVDSANFTVRYSKDIRGIALVLGIFVSISFILPLIILPFGNTEMTKSELIIATSIFITLLLLTIYMIFRVFCFKVEVIDDKLYIFRPFILKEFDINQLKIDIKQHLTHQYLFVFNSDKRILKLHHTSVNYT